MKLNLLMIITIMTLTFSTNAFALEVNFADNTWDGIKVPAGQQCQKFGGDNPATPKWIVSDIPAGSNALLLEYSDRDSERMNNGGHGRMQFAINTSASTVTIPSVPGHTYMLPQGFTMVEAHRGPGWDKEGAYMPPCSGGKDHAYYLTIKALKDEMVTAETVIEMGKY
ncbi:hypothetical protein SAMN05660420_00798 [Desulfuromusa kysingii]|uniref:Phospholipid-binding protein, PBP family n=1 Tax=Desulfuromusa kysingii TaxID=37625 RepID=A0A1H3X4W1_9BACT|nr:hypothetical protein [Desulfuromusa kysingii]SDZ93662.1 hypothetical protein SAMN05660420_00798 [Desulfuromusa kysingii]